MDRECSASGENAKPGPIPRTINVVVACVTPDKQFVKTFQVPNGTTVGEAIVLSGLQKKFPQLNLAESRLGIFGRLVGQHDRLAEDDRVEIYRPLLIDPKEARRRRAQQNRVR